MAETEVLWELVTFDDAAVCLSEGEQALLNSSQRVLYGDVVQASLDNPVPKPDLVSQPESGEESQVKDPEGMEEREVPSPASLVLCMRDQILEAFRSVEASHRRVEEALQQFLHGQHQLQEHLERLLARQSGEEGPDHLELRLDRLNANVFAIVAAMGDSAPKLISDYP